MKYKFAIFFAVLIAVVFFLASMPLAAQNSTENTEIPPDEVARYIEQLGAGDFRTREQAQEKLLEYGLDILEEIREAGDHSDPEIADRAKQILSEIELDWLLAEENPDILELIEHFRESPESFKLEIIQGLTEVFPKGEGIETLCRIARFDRSAAIRFAAVKEIIGVAPVSYLNCEKWYDSAAKHLAKVRRKNETLQFLDEYLVLRAEVAKFSAEKEKSPEIAAPAELKAKLEKWTKSFEKYRGDEKYSGGHLESDTDILYYYALADLQDGLGLEKELEKTLEATKNISMWGAKNLPVDPWPGQQMFLGDGPYLYEGRAYGIMAHFQAAMHLMEQYRLRWAECEYSFVAATDGQLKWFSRYSLAMISELKNDCQKSVEYLGEIIDAADEAKDDFLIMSISPKTLKAKHLYFKATVAAQAYDWDTAAALLDEAVNSEPGSDYMVDIVILRHSLPNRDEAYKKETEKLIGKTLEHFEALVQLSEKLDHDKEFSANNLNTIAWLLANTDREPEKAIEYSKRSLEANPDNPASLDTLAHAFFAAGSKKEAVETQEKACFYAPEATLFKVVLEKFRE